MTCQMQLIQKPNDQILVSAYYNHSDFDAFRNASSLTVPRITTFLIAKITIINSIKRTRIPPLNWFCSILSQLSFVIPMQHFHLQLLKVFYNLSISLRHEYIHLSLRYELLRLYVFQVDHIFQHSLLKEFALRKILHRVELLLYNHGLQIYRRNEGCTIMSFRFGRGFDLDKLWMILSCLDDIFEN